MCIPRVLVPCLIAIMVAVACSDSPTAPSATPAGVPDVAGTYRGPITLTITGAPGHLPMRDTGQFTVTATQAGSTVTLSATARWPWGDQVVWTDVAGTIDTLGTFTGNPRDTHTDPDCGRVDVRERQATFTLGTFRYHLVADTATCGRFEYAATLRGVGALIQRGGRAVAGMLTIATAGGS